MGLILSGGGVGRCLDQTMYIRSALHGRTNELPWVQYGRENPQANEMAVGVKTVDIDGPPVEFSGGSDVAWRFSEAKIGLQDGASLSGAGADPAHDQRAPAQRGRARAGHRQKNAPAK